jgi:hypothetical protein
MNPEDEIHDDDPEALLRVSISPISPSDESLPVGDEDEDESEESSQDGTYESHVTKMNTEYLMEYEAFERSLSPDQRRRLAGASVPDLPSFQSRGRGRREVIGITRDAAESSAASFTEDFQSSIDSTADEIREKFLPLSPKLALQIAQWHEERVIAESEKRKAGVIITIAGAFLGGSNVKLLAAGLAYATDLAITSGMGTMQAWAIKTGLSKQAISKSAKWWKKALGLPGGSHMRDEETCASYQRAQTDKHWRKTRYGNN